MRAWTGAMASSRFSRTVFSGLSLGSWGTRSTRIPLVMVAEPMISLSSPAMIRRRVDFPAPLSPTMPIFAPR